MTLEEIEQKIESLKQKRDNVVGRTCEIYTRISGYHRSTTRWNKGKLQEQKDRKGYKVN